MSDDNNLTDPDCQPKLSTLSDGELKAGCNASNFVPESKSTPNIDENDFQEETDKMSKQITRDDPDKTILKPKKDRRTSLIWTKFTIVSKKDQIATCNICDQRMSMKSTSNNLKKHLERKHGYSINTGVTPRKPKYILPTPRPKISELSGITDEGITVKVVGENGEEEHFQLMGNEFLTEEVVDGGDREHNYNAINQEVEVEEVEFESERPRFGKARSVNEPQSSQSSKGARQLYTPYKSSTSFMDDKSKRKRIAELQIECMENKKYNMQLEALLMEQQLNLPRSIFTETLQYRDIETRGTQTEVGGSDTKVFYISDKRGGRPIQQLFALQEMDL